MPRYRRKSATVEARRFDGSAKGWEEMSAWMRDAGVRRLPVRVGPSDAGPCSILIPTLKGGMLAQPGDWIVRGTVGDFYPCKPDVFERLYGFVQE